MEKFIEMGNVPKEHGNYQKKLKQVFKKSNKRDLKRINVRVKSICTGKMELSNELEISVIEDKKNQILYGDNLFNDLKKHSDNIDKDLICGISKEQLQSINTSKYVKELKNKELVLLIKQTLPLKSTLNISAGAFFLRYSGLKGKIIKELKKPDSGEIIINMVKKNNFDWGNKYVFLKPLTRFFNAENGLRSLMINSLRIKNIREELINRGVIDNQFDFSKKMIFMDNNKNDLNNKVDGTQYIKFVNALTDLILDKNFKII